MAEWERKKERKKRKKEKEGTRYFIPRYGRRSNCGVITLSNETTNFNIISN